MFLLTCDLPYLTEEWLQTLRDIMTDEYDLVCTEEGNITNPLLALYRRPVLEPAAELLAKGKRRPILLWEGWRMARLSSPEETPWICKDVNTPDEFKKAQLFYIASQTDVITANTFENFLMQRTKSLIHLPISMLDILCSKRCVDDIQFMHTQLHHYFAINFRI